MDFSLLPGTFSISRFSPGSPVLVDWTAQDFFCVTKTSEELSVVCRSGLLEGAERSQDGWRVLKIAGPLDFGLVGILAEASAILAEAKVSIFAISTFDTDYLLVRNDRLSLALEALRRNGHSVVCLPDVGSALDCARARGGEIQA